MKTFCLLAASLFFGTSLWGQAAPSPNVTAQPSQSASQPNAQSRITPPADSQPLHMQMSRQMELELQEMQAKLAAMKTNGISVKDPAVRKQIQLDTELWDLMVAHMKEVTLALTQMQRQRLSAPSQASQMYRRQLLQGRMGGSPAGMPVTTPAQPPAPDHP